LVGVRGIHPARFWHRSAGQPVAGPFEPFSLPDGRVIHGLVDIPAVIIIFLISMLLMIGILESLRAWRLKIFRGTADTLMWRCDLN
jgi:hypothetical protein